MDSPFESVSLGGAFGRGKRAAVSRSDTSARPNLDLGSLARQTVDAHQIELGAVHWGAPGWFSWAAGLYNVGSRSDEGFRCLRGFFGLTARSG